MAVRQESIGLDRLTEYEVMTQIKQERIQRLKDMRAMYEAKAKKVRAKYWETGSGALKPAEDAEDIVDVIDLALRHVDDDGREYLRRRANINGLIDKLEGKNTFTKDEVVALLRQSMDM